MEDTGSRSSGLPRPSKLPTLRSSGLPRPAESSITLKSAIPSTVRRQPSRESLSITHAGRTGPSVPRLRGAASHSQLRPTPALASRPGSSLRSAVSREQLRQPFARAAPPKTPSLPSATPRNTRVAVPTSKRTSHIEAPTSISVRQDTPQSVPESGEDEQVLFKRRLTLTRRPSESFSPPQQHISPIRSPDLNDVQSSTNLDLDVRQLPKKLSRPPRQSLSERTMETLAQIPTSPLMSRKRSTFFDQPRARADSEASQSGLAHISDGHLRHTSRDGYQKTINQDFDEQPVPTQSTTRVTVATTATPRKSSASGMSKPSAVKARPTLTSATQAESTSRNATTPMKSYEGLKPKPKAKIAAARPSNQKAVAAPSDPETTLDQPSSSAWNGSIAPLTPSKPADSESVDVAGSASRKSSVALRDQIARAKAARRAAVKQTAEQRHSPTDNTTPIVPSDDGFDFGVASLDPFNEGKRGDPGKKVLQQRIRAARTSGKLNIAALGLKEIPNEVMKIYDPETVGSGNWAESVDLTRMVAADNELETLGEQFFPDDDGSNHNEDDDAPGNIFGGLETMDLHNNLLVSVPVGLRQLSHLTSLNLSSNRLSNDSLAIIAQAPALRDLKLANNLFFGPLNPIIASLSNLEILDVHGNNISALPPNFERLTLLRILDMSENSFETIDFDGLSKLPLTELTLKKNKLSGTLIEEPIESLPYLQTLDVSANQIQRLVPLGASIGFPVLHALSLSMNRMQGLPDMTSWGSLLTLTVDENSISSIPNSFMSLTKLRHADFSSNDIRVVPPEISRMDQLSMIRLSGNPLRDKKFVSITTEDLKEILAGRLEPPPPYQEPADSATITGLMSQMADMVVKKATNEVHFSKRDNENEDDARSENENFVTPPTSAPQSPSRSRSQTMSSLRSRSQTLSNQTWPLKSGGMLDRSNTESSSLHPVVCSQLAAEHVVKQVLLHHNLFGVFPNSLSFFAETLTTLSLAHNQLVGETYLEEPLDLPALKELNLSNNRITSLSPLLKFLVAPAIEKMDVSVNRINALPTSLRATFPVVATLIVSSNQIVELEPEAIRGIRCVDAASNDISHLNPRIGLLGGRNGLEKLEVMGNRFRVPRWNVLERGTDATLRWLRGRVPVAEMAAWKRENEDDSGGDVD